MDQYEAVIGLEIHAQLLTDSKIFCGCSTRFGAAPNSQVCPVCLAMPGTLPVLNQKALDFAIRAGLATHCSIQKNNVFARKNYFYPDLPKGYQISQYDKPICEQGYVDIDIEATTKRIGITRIHMEEDAGKSVHAGDTDDTKDAKDGVSLIDLNRAGMPLVEIVSEPDIRTPKEAGAYLRKLRELVRYLEICDGNMEQGSMRCDANVSVRPKGQKELGTRTELKNMNSIRYVEKAIAYEIERQINVVKSGGEVVQETLLWDEAKGQSRTMRSKEEAHDYRYFPEPDLIPVQLDDAWIEKIKSTLPELPDAKRERFVKDYALSEYDAGVLTGSKAMADYFETVAKTTKNPKASSNWISSELLGRLNKENKNIEESPVSAQQLAQLIGLIDTGKINGKLAKQIFESAYKSGKDPEVVMQEEGLSQISDTGAIEKIVKEVIEKNPKQAEQYRAGKQQLIGFFVGQVMQASRGQADPQVVQTILQEML